MYERTHAVGMLQNSSPCVAHRELGVCEHVHWLSSLLVQQVPLLNRRFQAMHGRRHGDFKANNVLVERGGTPRLADFLSAFCRSCDRNEFLGSIPSMHPAVRDM